MSASSPELKSVRSLLMHPQRTAGKSPNMPPPATMPMTAFDHFGQGILYGEGKLGNLILKTKSAVMSPDGLPVKLKAPPARY